LPVDEPEDRSPPSVAYTEGVCKTWRTSRIPQSRWVVAGFAAALVGAIILIFALVVALLRGLVVVL